MDPAATFHCRQSVCGFSQLSCYLPSVVPGAKAQDVNIYTLLYVPEWELEFSPATFSKVLIYLNLDFDIYKMEMPLSTL